MSRIHVLHVVPTLRAGGMELALARIVNGLSPEAFSHAIIALKGESTISDQLNAGVRVHCVNARARDPMVPLRLRAILRHERPQVVHARNFGAWPEIALARLTVWPLVPFVFSFHGLAEAKSVPWRWRTMSRLLARITPRLFTVSEASKHFLVDHIGLLPARIAVIPNGVDTERFSPATGRGAEDELVIGTVGSLSPVKNQALLIRACHQLIGGSTRIRLEIAGEGPLRGALAALAAELGMGDRVRLRGQLRNPEEFLHGLDVFVLPSDSEGHPNALAEAMACGLPCVASRVGGIPEIVDGGRAARLFPRGDQEGLVRQLGLLLADPDLRRELGHAARNFIAGRYGMQLMLDRYGALYLDMASPGNAEC